MFIWVTSRMRRVICGAVKGVFVTLRSVCSNVCVFTDGCCWRHCTQGPVSNNDSFLQDIWWNVTWWGKGIVFQKGTFCHHLLTIMLSQTCMNVFLLWNTKDVLKNINAAYFTHLCQFHPFPQVQILSTWMGKSKLMSRLFK